MVTYERSSSTPMTVKVARVGKIAFSMLTNKAASNAVVVHSDNHVKVQLQLLTDDNDAFTPVHSCGDSTIYTRQHNVECRLAASSAVLDGQLSFSTEYDDLTDGYACVIKPSGVHIDTFIDLKFISVVVTVRDTEKTYSYEQIADVAFSPAFVIQEDNVEIMPKHRSAVLTVLATNNAQFIFSEAPIATRPQTSATSETATVLTSAAFSIKRGSTNASIHEHHFDIFSRDKAFNTTVYVMDTTTGQVSHFTLSMSEYVEKEVEAAAPIPAVTTIPDEPLPSDDNSTLTLIWVALAAGVAVYLLVSCRSQSPAPIVKQNKWIDMNASAFEARTTDARARSPNHKIKSADQTLSQSIAQQTPRFNRSFRRIGPVRDDDDADANLQ